MTDFVRALDTQTGRVVNLDLTPQWSPPGTRGKEQQAVTEGNAKYTGDTRVKGKPCSEIPPGFAAPKGWQGCSHGYMAPHLVWPQQTLAPAPEPVAPVKRGRGRPKGSKNKSKGGGMPLKGVDAVKPMPIGDTDPTKLAAVIAALKDAGLV